MNQTIQTEAEVRSDHTMIITLPNEVPLGKVEITVTFNATANSQKMTGKELAESEFFGMFADRDRLPDTNEKFIEWRKRQWARDCD